MSAASPLVKKLFIKPGHRVALVGAPRTVKALLAPLPEGATLGTGTAKPPYDLVLGFVHWQKEAIALAKESQRTVADGSALWLAYPKLSAGAESDLHRDVLHAAVAKAGWDGVSLVAVDGVWSAMRFKRAPAAQAAAGKLKQSRK